MSYAEHLAALKRQLSILPFLDEYRETTGEGGFDPDLTEAILDEAARFSERVLAPLGDELDAAGVSLDGGRVVTGPAHRRDWTDFCAKGWLSMSEPQPVGLGLPLAVVTACEELFNRASPSFYMLATSGRTAASLIARHAPKAVQTEWLPRLVDGSWGATICISEPEAGSDVGRIRTRAEETAQGWRVTGEKCWISFGDHDLCSRIGHLLLARGVDKPGAHGLSLFLVPSTLADGSPNGVVVRRLEEKMGLHGSPTCSMGFEGALATPLGPPGRGLQTLFHMMLLMRLACGPQGVGVAAAAAETALAYAKERRQGGDPRSPAARIIEHADIQRQLLAMSATVECMRGLTLAAAMCLEVANASGDDTDPDDRTTALAQFLLPLVKDGAAWAAIDVSSTAVQVLGGAGYTREWPVERYLRDSRVFAVFEGTTGIQALDLLHRRLWRGRSAGFDEFMMIASEEAKAQPDLAMALAELAAVRKRLEGWVDSPRRGEAGAVAFLELCKLCACGWIAARLVRLAGDDQTGRRMKAAAAFFLAELPARAIREARLAVLGDDRLSGIADIAA